MLRGAEPASKRIRSTLLDSFPFPRFLSLPLYDPGKPGSGRHILTTLRYLNVLSDLKLSAERDLLKRDLLPK